VDNKNNDKNIFMVECKVPTVMNEEFIRLVPAQQTAVREAMMNGSIISHSLTADHSKAWFTVAAEDKMEVRRIMRNLPLTRFLKIKILDLAFYNEAHAWQLPEISLN